LWSGLLEFKRDSWDFETNPSNWLDHGNAGRGSLKENIKGVSAEKRGEEI